MSDTIPQNYYVYTLSKPNGEVFYVGKGQIYTSISDRIDDHERQAKGGQLASNKRKIAVIQEIWASKQEVIKTKVAFFDSELDAYIYEWGLINVTCWAESLTNMRSGITSLTSPKSRVHKPKVFITTQDYPVITTPICLRHVDGRLLHGVTDPSKYHIKANTIKKLLRGEILSEWNLMNCSCQE